LLCQKTSVQVSGVWPWVKSSLGPKGTGGRTMKSTARQLMCAHKATVFYTYELLLTKTACEEPTVLDVDGAKTTSRRLQ
jgi:hypothetical protein